VILELFIIIVVELALYTPSKVPPLEEPEPDEEIDIEQLLILNAPLAVEETRSLLYTPAACLPGLIVTDIVQSSSTEISGPGVPFALL
jgi:hypothetical protein